MHPRSVVRHSGFRPGRFAIFPKECLQRIRGWVKVGGSACQGVARRRRKVCTFSGSLAGFLLFYILVSLSKAPWL